MLGNVLIVGSVEEAGADSPTVQPGQNVIKISAGTGKRLRHALFDLDTNMVHLKVRDTTNRVCQLREGIASLWLSQ